MFKSRKKADTAASRNTPVKHEVSAASLFDHHIPASSNSDGRTKSVIFREPNSLKQAFRTSVSSPVKVLAHVQPPRLQKDLDFSGFP